jgi:toxin ParE1/3/4
MQIKFLKRSKDDLAQIHRDISLRNTHAADKLIQRIYSKVMQLETNPKLGRQSQFDHLRELVIHPNYIVLYQIMPNQIEILRIRHAAQDWTSPL